MDKKPSLPCLELSIPPAPAPAFLAPTTMPAPPPLPMIAFVPFPGLCQPVSTRARVGKVVLGVPLRWESRGGDVLKGRELVFPPFEPLLFLRATKFFFLMIKVFFFPQKTPAPAVSSPFPLSLSLFLSFRFVLSFSLSLHIFSMKTTRHTQKRRRGGIETFLHQTWGAAAASTSSLCAAALPSGVSRLDTAASTSL